MRIWGYRALVVIAASLMIITPGFATQVCTTTVLIDKDINGISGSSDDFVIAVGKDGNIALWDGSAFSSMISPTTEELNDVEVVDVNTAFAVGKKGTVLVWDGALWTEQVIPTDKEMHGVWSDSAGEAWAVGKNGVIIYFDGVSWTDVSLAAGTGGDELTDAWGNSSYFYALDKKGVLYRLDRMTGIWDTPDNTCDIGGGNFEDLWGDRLGNIYLVKKDEVYFYDGSTCALVATADKDLLGIHGGGGQVVAVGKDGGVLEYDGSTWVETTDVADDFFDVWVSQNGNAYYAGKKGELTACECIDCVIPGFLIVHDNFGLNCQAESIRIDVIDILTGNPYADFSSEVTLDTQSGTGSWAHSVGGGAFTDDVADDGLARYQWPLGETTATFALDYRQGVSPINIDVYETVDPFTRDDNSEGDLVFSSSGFSVTAAALTNPPPALITPFSGPVTAGTDFTLYLTAFGVVPNDPQCGVIESYTGLQNLKFWSTYVDPGTGTVPVNIDGNAVATVEAAALALPVSFTNGQAAVVARYKDAGRLQISVKDDSAAHPDLPAGIRGATAAFVSRPARFVLSNIASGATLNPAAANATGPVFVAAGDPFSVTVTAVDASGDPTPNFGRESTAESVALTSNLLAPLPGANPPIASTPGFAAFSAGQSTGNDFSWSEVGIISIVPAVADGDYMGTGNIIGDASGNVGRFIPHHFSNTLNAPVFNTICDSGGFSYVGEPFGFLTQPVITLQAEAAGNTVTTNYTGSFWKLSNATLANRAYTAATGTLDSSGLPSIAVDPAIVDAGDGTGLLSFSSGSGLVFQRTVPQPPFDAQIQLSIDVIDADNVQIPTNPVIFGNPGGIAFDAGRSFRFGRVRVASALGSEVIELNVPMLSEYFDSTAAGFIEHADDSCSAAATIGFSNFSGSLAPGETCVLDSGAPGSSGQGCAAAAPLPRQYRVPPLAGDFNLYLAAPGPGNHGAVTVTATVPSWLQYDWDASLPGDEMPQGRVTFGVFRGDDSTIYQREVY